MSAAYLPELLHALRPFVSADKAEGMARCFLGAVSKTGIDFSFISRPGMHFGISGGLACEVLLKMDHNCLNVLRQCHNKMNGSPPDAPFESVTLPVAVSKLLRNGSYSPQTANLMNNLDKTGVRALTIRLSGPKTHHFDSASRLSCLQEINLVHSDPDERWSAWVLPGTQVKQYGEVVPTDRMQRQGDAIMVSSHPEPAQEGAARTSKSLRAVQEPANLPKRSAAHSRTEKNLPAPGGAKRLQAPALRLEDRLLHELDEALRPHGLSGLLPAVDRITLSPSMSRSFIMKQSAGHPGIARDWLPSALGEMKGLRELAVELPADVSPGGEMPPMDFCGLGHDTPQRLSIRLECPPVPEGEWEVHVQSGVRMMVSSDHRVVGQEVRIHPWDGYRPQQVLILPAPGQRTAENLEEAHAGCISDLVAALNLHQQWRIGVRPHEIRHKALLLLNWAGPLLDFRNPPQELRGILEIVTPDLLTALRKIAQAKDGRGLGVRQLTLSPSMSSKLVVQPSAGGSPLPVLSNWLTTELNEMKGLTQLRLDLPADDKLATDLRCLVRDPGQLSFHFDCPTTQDVYMPAGARMVLSIDRPDDAPHVLDMRTPVHVLIPTRPAMRDVYLPAGARMMASSDDPYSAQYVQARPWDGAQFQPDVILAVPTAA